MPRCRALSWNTIAENRLPCSVTASDGHLEALGLGQQLADAARAVEQRVLRVQVQMDELGHVYSHSIVEGGFELMS